MSSIRTTIVAGIVLAGVCPTLTSGPLPARADAGAIRLDALISGPVHDSGSITSGEAVFGRRPPDFNGCAIIKHAHTELGVYTLDIRINPGSFLLGGWQKGAVDFMIADYRPNVRMYTSPSFGGRFAFKGHAYGASVTYSRVEVRDGGGSGLYTDTHAYALVPGTANALLKAGTLTFRVSWHCATVFHLSGS